MDMVFILPFGELFGPPIDSSTPTRKEPSGKQSLLFLIFGQMDN